MTRFSEAILNEIRNRELLAQALAEQQQEELRRRKILRGILAALPLALSVYLLSNEPMPYFETLDDLKSLFGGKQILKQVEAQLEKSEQVMIAAQRSTRASYVRDELPDEIFLTIESRQDALTDFMAKRAPASVPVPRDGDRYERISAEELLRRVPEAEVRAVASAPYRPAEAADLALITPPPSEGGAPAEYQRGRCHDEGCLN